MRFAKIPVAGPSTALAPFTQAALGYGEAEERWTASRLLGLYNRIPQDPSKTGLGEIDLTLPGRTWVGVERI